MIKHSQEMLSSWRLPWTEKTVHKEMTDSMTLRGGKQDKILLTGTRQGYLLSVRLFNSILVRTRNKIIWVGKE